MKEIYYLASKLVSAPDSLLPSIPSYVADPDALTRPLFQYAECPSVSREECRDCVSGDSQCQCGINDFCQGDLFGSGIKEFE